ncbi:hypothetical protein [Phormidium sp. CCY1219]|uniref:hypothetical protein n=1 Tax=Phormidium sp. CCY1219 TaxID=2886104 RepID=UPI002D1EBDD8|nr:hypothetical protein [Phormidium sp. CCY1219]MEB3827700.1 hypothetical protein [Phormidium sp. CCY1219]
MKILLAIATVALITPLSLRGVARPGNSSQEFFERGQEEFEREIQTIAETDPIDGAILIIDESVFPEGMEHLLEGEGEESDVESSQPVFPRNDWDFRQFDF